jgi:uncharacterized membrane protein
MTTHRLQALADGIFAIAMTLLVFDLKAPVKLLSAADLHHHLVMMWPQFWTFGQSFLLLGTLWIASNRHIHFIEHADQRYLWLNIVWLMFVVLLPFSTSLLARYHCEVTGALFFHINLLLLGALFYLNWRYATRRDLVRSDVEKELIRKIGRRNMIFPLASLCAILLSFATPQWSSLAYVLVLLSARTISKRSAKK